MKLSGKIATGVFLASGLTTAYLANDYKNIIEELDVLRPVISEHRFLDNYKQDLQRLIIDPETNVYLEGITPEQFAEDISRSIEGIDDRLSELENSLVVSDALTTEDVLERRALKNIPFAILSVFALLSSGYYFLEKGLSKSLQGISDYYNTRHSKTEEKA